MQYSVYLRGPNAVLELTIESETPPGWDGPDLRLGGGTFVAAAVLAVLPSEAVVGSGVLIGRG